MFCAPTDVAFSVTNGCMVRDGHIVTIDVPRLTQQHNRLSRELVGS